MSYIGKKNGNPNTDFLEAGGELENHDLVNVDASGKVGIGTTSPTELLEVGSGSTSNNYIKVSAANNTASGIKFRSDSSKTTGYDIGYEGNGNYFFFKNDVLGTVTERMRIDSSGNVGIGTSSPSEKLHISNSSNVYAKIERTGQGYVLVAAESGTNSIYSRSSADAAYPLRFIQGSAERMRIDSSGNLLLGTTTSSGTGLSIANDIYLQASGYNAWKQTNYNGGLYFNNGSDRVVINSNGHLLVGTTTQLPGIGNSVTGIGLHAGGFGSFFRNDTSLYVGRTGTGPTQIFYNGNSTVGNIWTSSSSTTYNTTSDYRLKENVVDMTGAIDRVKALQPRRFNFIVDADTTVDGFLAHEVSDVIPEAITGEKDATREEEYEVTPAVLDDDGNVVTEAVMGTRTVPDYQGIDQSKLVPLLTGALQEAITKIETLETTVADLTTRIEALENA